MGVHPSHNAMAGGGGKVNMDGVNIEGVNMGGGRLNMEGSEYVQMDAPHHRKYAPPRSMCQKTDSKQAGCTHPTGMCSCWLKVFEILRHSLIFHFCNHQKALKGFTRLLTVYTKGANLIVIACL